MKAELIATSLGLMALHHVARAQVVLYDRLGLPKISAIPNWDGGAAATTVNRGLQAGQRVANPGNLTISHVVGDWETTSFTTPEAVLIQVFALHGDTVGDLISQTLDTGVSSLALGDRLRIFSSLDLGLVADNAGGDVLVVMQPQSEFLWGSILWGSIPVGDDAFTRNYSSFGHTGEWSHSGWSTTTLMDPSLGRGELFMRIEAAVPSPGTQACLLLGTLFITRRRR